jgi:hypothetical protein
MAPASAARAAPPAAPADELDLSDFEIEEFATADELKGAVNAGQ